MFFYVLFGLVLIIIFYIFCLKSITFIDNLNINIKKNILFIIYIVFNLILVYFLFQIEWGFLYVSFFIMGSHLRDIYSIIYQLYYMKDIIKEYPELDKEQKYTLCCLIPVYAALSSPQQFLCELPFELQQP